MTDVIRIAHLRIAHQVSNPESGKCESNQRLFSHLAQVFLGRG